MTRRNRTLTAGPLGFPVTDAQAMAIEAVLKNHSKDSAFAYRQLVVAKGQSEVLPGERSDVSWISTEEPDRAREVVVARGLNDEQFRLNPIVTMNHCYHLPPVGKSLWRKTAKDGAVRGVKAKTIYPTRPETWAIGDDWPPDVAFALIQADLLRGKSIGFLPLKGFEPDPKTREKMGWTQVDWVIEEWMLLEYACTFLPTQQQAVVEAVSKSAVRIPEAIAKALSIPLASGGVADPAEDPGGERTATPGVSGSGPAHAGGGEMAPPAISRFTPLEEIEKALMRLCGDSDLEAIIQRSVHLAFHKARGGI